ncbi:MAG: oligosaccharide flippase family protein, partial [Thermoproteales archaeon]|nr:oligosaccharide flippase family protein [Thermoproteales archaeon]
ADIFKTHTINSLISGSLWVILGRILYYSITFITTSLITHSLIPKDYGILLQFSFLLDIGTTLSLISIDTALVRQIAFYKSKKDYLKIKTSIIATLLLSSIFTSLVMFSFIVFSQNISSFLLNDPSLSNLIKILSLAVPLNAITYVFLGYMSGFQDFGSVTLINTVFILINRTLLTFFILQHLDYYYWTVVIVFSTFAYIVTSIGVLIYKRKIYIDPIKKIEISSGKLKSEVTSLTKFGLSLFSMNIARILSIWSDNMIFPVITTLSFLSIVGLAKSVIGMINNTIYMISTVFLPYLSEVYASHDKEGISYTTFKITKISFFIYIPIFILFIPIALDFITFYAGIQYIESSLVLIPLLIISAVHIPSYSTWIRSEIAIKRPILPTKEALTSRLLYIVSSVFLIPELGYTGFILASVFAIIPFWTYFYRKSSADNTMKIDFKSMGKSLAISIPIALLIYLLKYSLGFYIALISYIPLIIIYINMAFLSKIITLEELSFIRKSSPRIIRKIFDLLQKIIFIKSELKTI